MNSINDISTIERRLLTQASQNKVPLNGSLELLPLCNLNCDMCYVRLSTEEANRQGGIRTFEEWMEVAEQMKKAGVLFLLLTGGEPLLYPDFQRLYLELKQMGMVLTINTNGTLIDDEWAAFFEKNKPRRINITLYGADDMAYQQLCHYPNGFSKVMKGIQLLKQHSIDIKVSSSLTKANRTDLERMEAVVAELNIPMRIDTYMLPATRERNRPYNLQARLAPQEAAVARVKALKLEMGKELFEQFVRQTLFAVDHMIPEAEVPGTMSCYAGSCSFTINWQGEMRPCVILSSPAASVFEMGFETAWKYIVEETEKILLSAKCSACRLRPLCRTCAASALLETGRYEGTPDYMCKYAEESLRLLRIEMEELERG